MTEQAKKYLVDIISAIDYISLFTQNISTFEDYLADIKTQSAVERQLSILGEAVKNFETQEPTSKLVNSQQIVGFRNRLVHAYDSIDNSIVWTIIQRYLEPLKQDAVNILSK
jgi:uncharacterized protein with HEPN domain